MGSTLSVALIGAFGVIVSAAAGVLGHILTRRSERDDDVRGWVELQLARQDKERERQDEQIRALQSRVDGLEGELRTERAERAQERMQRVSLAAYVRMLWAWIERRIPGERVPEPTGPALEAMSDA